jgi:hypothetical protein
LTVPTSLQPVGSFGFTRTNGLLPTFGGLSLAKAFAEKQIATRMTRALIVIFPFSLKPPHYKVAVSSERSFRHYAAV